MPGVLAVGPGTPAGGEDGELDSLWPGLAGGLDDSDGEVDEVSGAGLGGVEDGGAGLGGAEDGGAELGGAELGGVCCCWGDEHDTSIAAIAGRIKWLIRSIKYLSVLSRIVAVNS